MVGYGGYRIKQLLPQLNTRLTHPTGYGLLDRKPAQAGFVCVAAVTLREAAPRLQPPTDK